MPTPEHAEQPRRQPTPSVLSMKDLLASCAAATAVSTPPADAADEPDATDGDDAGGHEHAVRRRAA